MMKHQILNNKWLGVVAALAMGLLAFSSPTTAAPAETAAGANTVEKVDYSELPGGKVVVNVTLKKETSQAPASFTTTTPPRIAFDFVNADNGLTKNSISIGDGLLRSINAVQANNRTRIVLNLSKTATYTSSVQGRNIVITLQPSTATGTAETTVTHFAQASVAEQQNAVTAVDFQRGRNGEGRVIVNLQEPGSGIDIRQQGKNLVVEFQNTAIAENLERRLNVTNFATPVLTVDTFKKGKNTRMVIEPKGEWEHSAYQTEKQFIVEIKPIIFDPNKIVQGSKTGFSGEKLSLDFNGIDVKSLLRIIGDFTGKNVVVSDSIQGTITLRLKDVPWDQALDIIMKQKGLGMDNLGNTLVFAPKEEIAARRKQDQDQENLIDDSKPLVTQSFQIKYQKAADIKTLISDPKQPLLSKRGTAVVDPSTNTMFVKDIDTSMTKIQEILNKIDIPSRQVLIESRIVQANDTFGKSLGARFGVVKNNALTTKGLNANDYMTSGSLSSNYSTAQNAKTTNPDDLNVNLPASATAGTVSSAALTLLRLPAGFLLNMELSAAESDSKIKTISSPRVITANQQAATFDAGTEIPYQQATSSGATSVSFKKATLGVNVTPQITPDDKINLDIEVTKDDVGQVFNGVPSIDTNKVKTKVLVDNGETAVLGGFLIESKNDSTQRVPFFSSIPVVGNLFKSNLNTHSKKELLFFITPKIMSDAMQLN
ncbi:type IV pilus assembly protein PilQ [Novimethylophilus kurashikiensis]|uniref:Type IV pilus biogenesis and competence protein PilQ n=1 Tax=Novimethylophilus kurashikiensis TaxID=1825523 RepID=A0A2R5F6N8_9PROT|nr:type IV pilus secretin family protein [Novimethylophilus kurashikiensis]GBG13916.1 type IV pilus assembly protein PilQ [Novimethylophilus kurashikiensis]